MQRTIVRRPRVSPEIKGLHPVLQQVFCRRDIPSREQLDLSLSKLLPPAQFKSMDKACARLLTAIDNDERVLILGDYDTDGATASVVAILGLRLLGTDKVDYLVPNRFEYGYGLSPEIARVAIDREPGLVITVDNGISSLEGVRILREAGIDVIITDHHLAGEELPEANAVVNPNQPGCEFQSKALAGVGVMFYLLLALRARMRQEGRFDESVPNLAQLLDLVALGTVADVVPLDYNNRILVAQGIARIQRGQCRPGIRALIEVANRNPDTICTSDLGFYVAPRLNAAGRLDDISMGIECLLADDPSLASELASVLNEINLERRQIQAKMQSQALKIVEHAANLESDLESDLDGRNPGGICLHDASWHQGITGLIASKLKDRYQRPSVVFASVEGGRLTGSARSVPGLHIRDLLEGIALSEPDLIEKYGGHAMAAGLTIAENDLDRFRICFAESVKAHFERFPHSDEVLSDGALEPEFFTKEVAELLRSAAPWGQQFSAPLFDNEFRVLSTRVLGGQHLKLRLGIPGGVVEGVAFGQLENGDSVPAMERVHAAFRLEVNEYRGTRNLQLLIEHLQPLAQT